MSGLITERRVVSFIILLLTTGLVVSTYGKQYADLGGAFSPMFFPRIILVILLVLCAVNLVTDLVGNNQKKPIELVPVLIISVAFIAYVLLINTLGYFICSVVVGIVILLALGLRNPIPVIGVPLVGASALVVLFNHVLTMPLPTSPFVWWI